MNMYTVFYMFSSILPKNFFLCAVFSIIINILYAGEILEALFDHQSYCIWDWTPTESILIFNIILCDSDNLDRVSMNIKKYKSRFLVLKKKIKIYGNFNKICSFNKKKKTKLCLYVLIIKYRYTLDYFKKYYVRNINYSYFDFVLVYLFLAVCVRARARACVCVCVCV